MIIVLLTYFSLARSQSCGDNPFLGEFQNLLNSLHNQNLTLVQSLNAYVASTPEDATLATCTQFAKASCCTPAFEAVLEQVVQLYYSDRKEQSFPYDQIMTALQTSIQNCAIRDPLTFKTLQEIDFGDVLFQYHQAIAKLLQANVRFLRGNLCILCASEYASYITTASEDNDDFQLKLIVTKTSYESYLNAITSVYEQLNALKPAFTTILSKYFTDYADTIQCGSIL